MKIHIFDLDHTLINADSDYLWKFFAVEKKLVSPDATAKAEAFYEDYKRGCLNHDKFIAFQFAEFAGRAVSEVAEWTREFFDLKIRSHVRQEAWEYVRKCQESGALTAILSSTCEPIVRPAAEFFGISEVIGTKLETVEGIFSGRVAGVYGVGEGKIPLAEAFCCAHGAALKDAAYYGDSINDRYVLEKCGEAVVVCPDQELDQLAAERGWRRVFWR